MMPITYVRWFAIFLAILSCAAAALLAGALYSIRLARQPGYPVSSGDAFLLLIDNAFQLRDHRCDVLIYGDSTASVGLDPRIITAQTGLSACNIGTSLPVIDDLGTIPLDAFLAHNPKPKLLVLQFGPEAFYRAANPWEHAAPFEPMVTLTRELPQSFALWKMLQHPAETSKFISFMVKGRFHLGNTAPVSSADFSAILRHAEQSNGQLDLNLPPLTHCETHKTEVYGTVDPKWVKRLRIRYESQGIPVTVRVSPLPSCDLQLGRFQHDLTPLVDGGVEALPVSDFTQGDRHPTLDGSRLVTLDLVQAIRTRLPASARQESTQREPH